MHRYAAFSPIFWRGALHLRVSPGRLRRIEPTSPATQRYWLFLLQQTWERTNRTLLAGALRPPQLALDEGTTRLGRWTPETRTIGIGIDHILTAASWLEVELTLRHEMAHQVVSELFKADNAAPHGELFRRACRLLGVDASPRAERQAAPEHIRILDRVRKLMNLASSDNPHEAQAAMAAANRLLLRHNIDLPSQEKPDFTWRWVGLPSYRVTLERKLVGSLLQSYFFVQCVWMKTHEPVTSKSGSVLEISGRPHNLELAEYVHDYLFTALDRLYKSFKRQNPHVRGARAKRDFRVGVLMGFREQLEAQREQSAEQGLVWLGDPGLRDFLRRRHPQLGTLKGSSYRLSEHHSAGREQGKQLRIRPGMEGETTSRGRRLK